MCPIPTSLARSGASFQILPSSSSSYGIIGAVVSSRKWATAVQCGDSQVVVVAIRGSGGGVGVGVGWCWCCVAVFVVVVVVVCIHK